MSGPSHRVEIALKLLGSMVEGSRDVRRFVYIALLSTADGLLALMRLGLVSDVRRFKESLVKRAEAEAKIKDAEAKKIGAEATRASNEATAAKRSSAMKRIEERKAAAEAAKSEAEVEEILARIANEKMKEMAAARARLLEKIAQLRREDGDFMLSEENLLRILDIRQPDASGTTRRPADAS